MPAEPEPVEQQTPEVPMTVESVAGVVKPKKTVQKPAKPKAKRTQPPRKAAAAAAEEAAAMLAEESKGGPCSETGEMAPYKHKIRPPDERAKPLKCEHCNQTFKVPAHKRNHIRVVHNKEKHIKCEVCPYTTGRPSDLNKHMRAVHEKLRPHRCEICGATSAQISNLRSHMAAMHDENPRDRKSYGMRKPKKERKGRRGVGAKAFSALPAAEEAGDDEGEPLGMVGAENSGDSFPQAVDAVEVAAPVEAEGE
mmetsp:Transcript_7706/g.19061  ORF Transcript_7706/g.19061 Transcript_7706/m.19061 type:complete len:252 (-) Transcript_7706:286-1041(-)